MFYCKLVRDKIPQIIERDGNRAITDILSEEEFEVFLERKLDEEVKEYHESKNVEELADILEVIISLAELKRIRFADLVDIQTRKAVKRGGFSKKILLIAVCEEQGEYLTPEEVRRMSPKEVRENYDLIAESMKRW